MPVIQGMDSEQAKQLGDAMTAEFQSQMAHLGAHFAPPPPPPPPQPSEVVISSSQQSEAADANMVAKNKRGLEEVSGVDDGGVGMEQDNAVASGLAREAQLQNDPDSVSSAARDSVRARELADRVQAALKNRGMTAQGQSSS